MDRCEHNDNDETPDDEFPRPTPGMTPFLDDGTRNPAMWRDCDDTVFNLFHELSDLEYDSELLLLDYKIDPGALPDCRSPVSWDSPASLLWRDKAHQQRCREKLVKCHRYCRAARAANRPSPVSGSESLCLGMLPWERCCGSLKWADQSEGDKWSVALGISFPVINLDLPEVRLLVLLPHHKDPQKPLECSLIVSLLFLHSCFVVVRQARGNPMLRGEILLDGKPAKISKNLEVFLRLIRRHDQPIVLWIRELCVNKDVKEELKYHSTWDYHQFVEKCSCGVLELPRVMEDLESLELIPHLYATKEKLWNELSGPEWQPSPWHRPKLLTAPPYPGFNLSQETINGLPQNDYVPLDLVAQEIRLITTDSKKDEEFDQPLVLDMGHVPMHGELSYAALSYTWGLQERSKFVQLGGGSMQVTENLDAALRHLRARQSVGGGSVTVWVDAICIDQDNEREKSLHIPRMQKIYEGAYAVWIWFGDAVSSTTIDFLHELFSSETAMFEDLDTGELKSDLRWAKAWADLYEFFQKPFFSRRWIIQEIASASNPNVLLDGQRVCHWQQIQHAAWVMSLMFERLYVMWCRHGLPLIPEREELSLMAFHPELDWKIIGSVAAKKTFERVMRLTYIRAMRESGRSPSFLFLALLTQHAECADPRDRIFSLWSISRESKESTIQLAYRDSIEEAYVHFVREYAVHTKSLDIICAAQWPAAANRTGLMPVQYLPALEMPSWCPDWQQMYCVDSLIRELILYGYGHEQDARLDLDVPRFHASSFERGYMDMDSPLPFKFDKQILTASGVILDSIKFVSPEPQACLPQNRPQDTWVDQALQHCSVTNGQARSREQIETDFHCMLAGTPSLPATNTCVGGDDKDVVTARSDETEEPINRIDYGRRVEQMVQGRRLVVTEKGFMGLAPWHVRDNFKVAILLGCSVPVLLEYIDKATAETIREECESDAHMRNTVAGWYFRGDVYVQGWMEGQTLRQYGETTQEVWSKIREMERLHIH